MSARSTILVLDDETDILDFLRDLLEDEGYAPVCVTGCEELEEISVTARPALYLLDMMLPGTTGIEVA
ncbi:MAG: response regulator, partial [Chloroflexota bacterium]